MDWFERRGVLWIAGVLMAVLLFVGGGLSVGNSTACAGSPTTPSATRTPTVTATAKAARSGAGAELASSFAFSGDDGGGFGGDDGGLGGDDDGGDGGGTGVHGGSDDGGGASLAWHGRFWFWGSSSTSCR